MQRDFHHPVLLFLVGLLLFAATTCHAGVMEYDLYFDEKCEFPVGAVKRFTTCAPDGITSSTVDCNKREVSLYINSSTCSGKPNAIVKLNQAGQCMRVPGSASTWMVMHKCTPFSNPTLGDFPTPVIPNVNMVVKSASSYNTKPKRMGHFPPVPSGMLCSVMKTESGCNGEVAAYHCMIDNTCFAVGASLNTRGTGRMSSKFNCATNKMEVWTGSGACVGGPDLAHTFEPNQCDGSHEMILHC